MRRNRRSTKRLAASGSRRSTGSQEALVSFWYIPGIGSMLELSVMEWQNDIAGRNSSPSTHLGHLVHDSLAWSQRPEDAEPLCHN
jgi:hypothetical protein